MNAFLTVFGFILVLWLVGFGCNDDGLAEWEKQDAQAAYYGY